MKRLGDGLGVTNTTPGQSLSGFPQATALGGPSPRNGCQARAMVFAMVRA
jgi:hypothetical protein